MYDAKNENESTSIDKELLRCYVMGLIERGVPSSIQDSYGLPELICQGELAQVEKILEELSAAGLVVKPEGGPAA